MAHPLRSVVVVGGGTAGWLAAACLNRSFGARVDVTVVESERIGRIGVGEATVPTLRHTFQFLGMREEEWMPRCNATFKAAVKHVGWRKPRHGRPHAYYHPFFSEPYQLGNAFGISTLHYWLENWMRGDRRPFGDVANPLPALCELNKAPKPAPGSELPGPGFSYAYHFDAAMIAMYLGDLAKSRGVRHLVGDIERAELDDRGNVRRLHTQQGSVIEGDLFVDCSGFRSLLLEQTLGEPFVSLNDMLLCDAAVAMPASNNPERDDLRPYTQANAMGDGWIWEIPLCHHDGTGYVYCSQTTSAAEAEQTLRGFLGSRVLQNVLANHIRMRVGYHRRMWVNNVVAIGLSGCFVEPLESTTIYLIERAIHLLIRQFPDSDFDDARRRTFNDEMRGAFDDIRDFIVMHYCLTDRDDTEFWRRVRSAPVPDSLRAKLAAFAEGVFTDEANRLFTSRSIVAILSGMEFEFRRSSPLLGLIDDGAARDALADVAERTRQMAATMPGHYSCLRAVHGEDVSV